MSARIGKQLRIITPNKVGMLAQVTSAIADTGVNIDAICAYSMEQKAHFMLITSDNAKAIKALKVKKIKVKEEKIVLVELENKVGAASEMSDKLKEAKINLNYIYGSTCRFVGSALLVFKSDNDKKAVDELI